MSRKVKKAIAAVAAESAPVAVVESSSPLPVIIPGTEPKEVETPITEPTPEAQQYAEHQAWLTATAVKVETACFDLTRAEKRAHGSFWSVVHAMALQTTPGNRAQFDRLYNELRERIIADLSKPRELTDDDGQPVLDKDGKPVVRAAVVFPKDATTTAAQWAYLCGPNGLAGYGSLANFVSMTGLWIITVKATVDPNQPVPSFARTVRDFYANRPKDKGKGGKGSSTSGTESKDTTPTVQTETQGLRVTAGLASVTEGKQTVNFPAPVIDGLGKLALEIKGALDHKVAAESVNQVLIGTRQLLALVASDTPIIEIREVFADAMEVLKASAAERKAQREAAPAQKK